MNNYLIVVDMQNDFVTGALGSAAAARIVPKVAEKIRAHREAGGAVVFTLDTHGADYLETAEGRKLPVEHCIKGTDGWFLYPEIAALAGRDPAAEDPAIAENFAIADTPAIAESPIIRTALADGISFIEKSTFGSVELARALADENEKTGIESVTLVGLCTDICVIANAMLLKAFLPETPIRVDAACCAGSTPEAHAAALAAMRSCQIEVAS